MQRSTTQSTASSTAQEVAEVSYVEGEFVFLKTSNQSSCSECSSKSSCGSARLFKPLVEAQEFKIKNTLGLKVGDSVVLGLPPSTLLQGTFLVYLIPLFTLILFAVLGKIIGGEGISIIAGVAGLVISLLMVNKYLSKRVITEQFTPKMLEKV
jgi:sigma-E factor negative regulatory protein RseC